MREKLSFIESDVESTYERYQRLFSAEELSQLAQSAGLVTKDVFGDFRGEQFDSDLSEKIVLVAEKGTNAAWIRMRLLPRRASDGKS
jgi:phosphopantothenate synthetase